MCNGITVFTAGRIHCVNAVAVIFFLASVLLPPPGMTAATFLVLFCLSYNARLWLSDIWVYCPYSFAPSWLLCLCYF
ncbi:hypothetical protein DFH08DRAFT_880560 [Mycena albidolilacea]|uniref:Uncharacterized protein n=1 Tax=Mycena albidolilacea TaxID=1033008 RepID=A0AAD6ZQ95_9AGAR|nr:hypothetical protein DFH08DRAFT_880560 [Mycena albidolilacea]